MTLESRSVSVGGNLDRSVVVSGDGNQVSLRFGGGDIILPIERRQHPPPNRRRARPGDPPRELDLLAADAGLLPFVGREDLMGRLRDWLEDDADVSVHGLIGPAGSGKTRLAIELCGLVDRERGRPGASGWLAGFLRPADLEAVVDTLATHGFDWPARALLVLDDAAAGSRPLARWLDRLAAEPLDGKLRLLLLDREAPRAFGWWRDLADPPDDRAAGRRDLFWTVEPEPLPGLDDIAQRAGLFWASAAAARRLHGAADAAAPPPPTGDPNFKARLAAPEFASPLSLAMAGLCAVERTPLEALSMRRLDAARRLARRELARFGVLGEASGVAASAMGHAVAFNTLVGGLALDGLAGRLEQEFSAAHLAAPTAGLCQILQQELPPRRGAAPASSPGPQRLGVVQPDLIGEGLVIEALLSADPATALAAPAVVRRAFAIDEGRASETLIRLAQDFGFAIEDPAASHADREAAAAVLRLLRATAEQIAAEDFRRLAPLVFAIPVETTVMRELALDLTERIAAAALDRAANDGDLESMTFAAIWRGNLSNRLSALGRREDAVRTAEQTVALFRALAESQPDAFASRLAMALDILGNMLRDLGRLEESLAASREAVSLFIDLSNSHPIAFADKLAIASGNLSATLLKLGRREDALAAADLAVESFRGLAVVLPGDFNPHLATSLNTFSAILASLGRVQEGLAAAEEAVILYRALAADRPDAFRPALANAFHTLAAFQKGLGKFEDALKASDEAVSLYGDLASNRPETFNPEFASALLLKADGLEALGRLTDAVACDRLAVLALVAAAVPMESVSPADPFAKRVLDAATDHFRRCEAASAEPELAALDFLMEWLEGQWQTFDGDTD